MAANSIYCCIYAPLQCDFGAPPTRGRWGQFLHPFESGLSHLGSFVLQDYRKVTWKRDRKIACTLGFALLLLL